MTAGDILRFDTEEKKLVVGDRFYQLPSLVAVREMSEKETKAELEDDPYLLYMYHVLHPNSVLAGLSLSQKILAARQIVDLNKEQCETAVVLRALSDYDAILEGDLSLKMLRRVTTGVIALSEYFQHVDFDKTIQSGNAIGSLLHNPKTLTSTVKDARPMLQELEALRKEVLDSLKVTTKVSARGGKETGNFKRFK